MKYPKLTREQSKKFIFITSQRSQSEERYDTDFPGDLVVKTLPSNAGSTDLIPGCFPDSSVGKESACKARDPGSTPGLGRSPGEGIGYPLLYSWASLVAQLVKNPPAMRETWVQYLGWEDLMEKGKATHSSILAWRIPRTLVHGVAKSQT